jgi:iron(III) transport system ATP-binding protein
MMQTRGTISVSNLKKKYITREGTVEAVKGISFEVGVGEFYTVLGPSGCGKTTTLRGLAGLEQIDDGEIRISGEVVANRQKYVPPYRRPIGMVFQSYAIWPHMTVAENVAFPLRNEKKYSRKEITQRVDEALALVQLQGLGGRPAPNLSGGQQQRLALARALVSTPAVLLLDEPLSNLDAKLREEMRLELKNLVRRLGITTFYVTHDQLEALVLSDRIALMRDGYIVEEGKQYDLYMYPRHAFTAGFFGVNNILAGEVIQTDPSCGTVQLEAGVGKPIVVDRRDMRVEIGQKIHVAIRPENLEIEEEGSRALSLIQAGEAHVNQLEGSVKEVVFLGDSIDYRIAVRDVLIRLKAHPEHLFAENTSVNILFDSKHACLLEQS